MIRLSSGVRAGRRPKTRQFLSSCGFRFETLDSGGALQGRNDSCAAFLRGPAPRAHTHATLIRIIHRQAADGFQVTALYSMRTPDRKSGMVY